MNRRNAIILLAAAAASRGGASTPASAHTFERGLMGTRFAISCHHSDAAKAKAAADAAFEAAERINRVASDYIADSELLELSKHPAGEAVTVSPLLYHLVSQARELAEKTNGCFDPTLGPLTRLWRESRRRKSLPDASTLSAARAASGWRNLLLDSRKSTITFAQPGMRLDLGGIAKGQAADAMLDVMVKHGIPACCITAGGDVRAGDPPPGAEGWSVGVRSGEESSEKLILKNAAASTSGDLHQFIELNGVRYSHIIDPATGLGLTRHVAATVIAPTAAASDALATACCVAPSGTAKEIAREAGATHVMLSE
ncbi:MAG: FAD:protein FMN transferase [Verrucomicrobiota bacterium]